MIYIALNIKILEFHSGLFVNNNGNV